MLTENMPFNYVGFLRKEVSVNNRATVNIKLEASSESLTEVVIVGYGQQRRTSVTGSIATISSKELTESPVPTVSQALVGKVAGITSRAPDGRPGAEARLQIRNLGDPLYVIDGVPSGPQQFNNLNSEDIESLSVLKDASAAIYGLRASNGVVLVTTKKGGLNKENRVNVNSYYGLQSLFRFPKAASAADYVRALAEADINQSGSSVWTPEEVGKWQQRVPGHEGYDWSSYIKDNAPQAYLNLNTTGGSQKTSYYLSLAHLNQDAVFDGYNFNRTNLQSNIETRIGERFKVGVKINGKIEIRDLLGLPGEDDYFQALLGQFRNLPTEGPYANAIRTTRQPIIILLPIMPPLNIPVITRLSVVPCKPALISNINFQLKVSPLPGCMLFFTIIYWVILTRKHIKLILIILRQETMTLPVDSRIPIDHGTTAISLTMFCVFN